MSVADTVTESKLNDGMRKEPIHWLDARLSQLKGKNLAGLARLLGIPAPRLTELKKGAWQLPSTLIRRTARYLEWTSEQLLEKVDRQHAAVEREINYNQITITGAVAAGLWRESIEWPADEWILVNVPKGNIEYEGLPIYGVQVVGDSMNRKFPEGTTLECVKYLDLGRQPESGEYVVVHRRNHHGLYECSIKRYLKDDTGKEWLLPESDRPEFQAPLNIEPTGEEDEVVIYARVIRAHLDI